MFHVEKVYAKKRGNQKPIWIHRYRTFHTKQSKSDFSKWKIKIEADSGINYNPNQWCLISIYDTICIHGEYGWYGTNKRLDVLYDKVVTGTWKLRKFSK